MGSDYQAVVPEGQESYGDAPGKQSLLLILSTLLLM